MILNKRIVIKYFISGKFENATYCSALPLEELSLVFFLFNGISTFVGYLMPKLFS